jgi:hypothetical protein
LDTGLIPSELCWPHDLWIIEKILQGDILCVCVGAIWGDKKEENKNKLLKQHNTIERKLNIC